MQHGPRRTVTGLGFVPAAAGAQPQGASAAEAGPGAPLDPGPRTGQPAGLIAHRTKATLAQVVS